MRLFIIALASFEVIALIGLLSCGNLSDGAIEISYASIVFLTMPVWGGILGIGLADSLDWFERYRRAKRITRASATKLADAD